MHAHAQASSRDPSQVHLNAFGWNWSGGDGTAGRRQQALQTSGGSEQATQEFICCLVSRSYKNHSDVFLIENWKTNNGEIWC